MAKRKRLTPVMNTTPSDAEGPLETKARDGWVGYGARRDSAPIADVAGSAATAAALDELAHELQTARASGRMVVRAALETIDEGYLVRDRAGLDSEEMETLKVSLRQRGQQTPIEVVEMEGARLGLISGWRRLTALKALHEEDPSGDFGHIQCLIRTPEAASDAYVAMVEENEIRASLSFYERARIAARAAEQGAFETPRLAAKTLFNAVPRAKRSKIYSFLDIYAHLDSVLKFPSALSEKSGLQLAKALAEGPARVAAIVEGLSKAQIETAQDESAALQDILSDKSESKPAKSTAVNPGISLRAGHHKLTLTGEGVTQQLEQKLRVWLSKQVPDDL